MKKVITFMAASAFIIFGFAACKKSTETQNPQTTLQKIQGKWFLVSDVYNDHFSGADHISTQTGGPNDYVEFRTDGRMFTSISGYTYTATYSLAGDTKVEIDTETYDIKTLTSKSLILYLKIIYSATEYEEQTITFKKQSGN